MEGPFTGDLEGNEGWFVKPIQVGSRGSALALVQTRWVVERLEGLFPGTAFVIVEIQTQGDQIQELPLSKVGGKGLFIKEIEQSLLNGAIDLAVHSLKDMPAKLPDGLQIGAISEREDPRDVLITYDGRRLKELSQGARIGTSSLRRKAQLLEHRPDLEIVTLRGNIQTRLRKLDEMGLDGIVLAAAGLRRMGCEARISEYFDPMDWIPAVGQGALAVELRSDDVRIEAMVAGLNHADTRDAVVAERAFLARVGGSCQVPVGAYACCDGEQLTLAAYLADPWGKHVFRETRQGGRKEGIQLGNEVAETLLLQGGTSVLVKVGQSE